MIGRWDPETGIVTYFDPADGDRLRREWMRTHVPTRVEKVRQGRDDPLEPPFVVLVGQDAGLGKPQPPGFVRVWLAHASAGTPADLADRAGAGEWRPFVFAEVSEDAVPLFACYVPEPGGVVALALVDGDGAVLEWTADQARPWLDGIRPLDLTDYRGRRPADGDAERRAYVESHVLPAVRSTFEGVPALRSAVLLVAQYWNDNASDEVSLSLTYSVLPRPSLEDDDAYYWHGVDTVNIPPGVDVARRLAQPALVSDELTIGLFAPFCSEGATQDDDPSDRYLPYACFTRAGGEIEVEVVGRAIRPWLEGLRLG